MKQSNNLKTKIWLYLSIFAFSILIFLWIFQILFLDAYYEMSKTSELNNTIREIKNNYSFNESFLQDVDIISKDNGICIQITGNKDLTYDSLSVNKGCIPNNEKFEIYKKEFINSNHTYGTITLVNERFNNKVLIKAVKLDNNVYTFASVSLEPLDSTIGILKNQFFIVSIVVLFTSFIVGYFISKKISVPIEKINKGVKEISKGNYKYKFETNENIAELDELIKNLNKATYELDKTETLKNELLSNVSHDLRTPLTMIRAYAEMVRDMTYKNKEKRNDNLNVIIGEADRLNNLVNDIIELSKIQSGAVKLEKENFDLINTINYIINKFDILNYNFILNHDEKKLIINADKKRIEQVIYNLLNNAINYTGKDKKIIIDIIKEKELIKVLITDTGKGINQKDIEYIWERYYKADKSYKRSSTGSGIGLSIVKNIFIMHGYEYGVTSSKNKGTTFWFKIKNDKNN